ncbi:hypothetical protein AB0L59_13845 [Streptomyces sp. NPDC052109]|uniref:hypothetical protein n=1 Tax=Streptomyces sp. NPDC052109 TaxID=3155527 RepID=UPI003427F2C2
MGERLSGDGAPGRRPAQPRTGSGASDATGSATLETALAAVLRAGDVDPGAERRAVAAFRAARVSGTHRARTRRRDDWRPAAERRVLRPLKTTFGVVFASLTLGGVAVAAIGSAGSSADGAVAGRPTAHPATVAPDRAGGAASSAPAGGSRPVDRPAPDRGTEAHCRAYEQARHRVRALDARARQQLVTAAGGEAGVSAYCSEQLARATATPHRPAGTGRSGQAGGVGNGRKDRTGTSGDDPSGKAGTPGKTGTPGNSGTSRRTGTSGNGTASDGPSGGTAGSGQVSDGQGGGRHR